MLSASGTFQNDRLAVVGLGYSSTTNAINIYYITSNNVISTIELTGSKNYFQIIQLDYNVLTWSRIVRFSEPAEGKARVSLCVVFVEPPTPRTIK